MPEEAKKPEVNYVLTDDVKKAVKEFAQLAADTTRAARRVENPKADPKSFDKECEDEKTDAEKTVTGRMEATLKEINKAIKDAAAKGGTIEVEVGGETIDLDSQANVDKMLKKVIQVEYTEPVTTAKKYFDTHLHIRDELAKREKAFVKDAKQKVDGKSYYAFSDLDVANFNDWNRDLMDAGKAMGMPEKKLKVEVLEYEEQVMQGVVRRPWLREDAKWRIDTDKDDLKKVQEKLKEARAAWAKQMEEMKKKAEEEAKKAEEGTKKAPAKPAEDKKKGPAPSAPKLEETLPPPAEIGPKDLPPKPKLSVMDLARDEVAGIMSGATAFDSAFQNAPVAKLTVKKQTVR